MTETFDKDLAAFEKDVEILRTRFEGGAREIEVGRFVTAIRAEHGTDRMPEQYMAPDYRDKIEAEAAARFDDETRDEFKKLFSRRKDMLATVTTAIDQARRLRSEAERIDPATNHAAWVNAELLDEVAEQRAEAWLEKHEHDQAAILGRYKTAGERGRDGAFARLIEQRYGFKPGEASGGPRLLSPLATAIHERQESRVPAVLRERLRRLDAAEPTLTKAKAWAFPSKDNLNAAVGAILGKKAS